MLWKAVCFLDFAGVSRELGVITSAVKMAPRLVFFSAHATRWNFGEVECSRARFLDMAKVVKGRSRKQ
jgi:hypothetical protein